MLHMENTEKELHKKKKNFVHFVHFRHFLKVPKVYKMYKVYHFKILMYESRIRTSN